MSKAINLTKDPIWSLLKKVTIPASVGSLFQTFYNLVDTWFAGRISAEAISAIAKSFPIYFVIIAVGVGIGAATNSGIGNLLGAKKINKASLFIAQSVIFALVTSVVVTLFGLNASDFLLGVMGSDAAGIALTREYLDIIFYGTFIVMIQISLNGALNAQGDTKSYRNVLIFSFFLNIFLNPLFIWGYGIVPAYGIGGLAIATVIAQSIGTIYLAYKINSCKLRKYLSIKCFIPKFILLKELFSQAMPIMISMLFIGVGIFNILYFIGQFGDLATAGYGAALRVEQVFLLPVIGLNTAVLSIGGQNFGAKNYNRIRELYTVNIIDNICTKVGRFVMYGVFFMMFLLILSFVTRNIINYPLMWIIEMAQFTLTAYYLLGGGYSMITDDHVRMDLFYGKLSTKGKAKMDIFTSIFLIFFLAILLYGSISSLQYTLEYKQKLFTAWAPYLWPIKSLMLLGILLMLLQAFSMLIKDIAKIKNIKI